MVRNYVRKLIHKVPVGKAYLSGPILMEAELKREVVRAAHRQRVTQAEIVREALAMYLESIKGRLK